MIFRVLTITCNAPELPSLTTSHFDTVFDTLSSHAWGQKLLFSWLAAILVHQSLGKEVLSEDTLRYIFANIISDPARGVLGGEARIKCFVLAFCQLNAHLKTLTYNVSSSLEVSAKTMMKVGTKL